MKQLSIDEIEATNRIFTRYNKTNGNYYGHKVKDETKRYASRNRWIMFPANIIDSLREGTEMPLPNVYMHTGDDEIRDDGNGRLEGLVGITYGNNPAMDWVRVILKSQKKSQVFLNLITGMGADWNVSPYHKIHTSYWQSTPIYEKGKSEPANQVTVSSIKANLNNSDNNRRKPGTFMDDGDEVISCVTTLTAEKYVTPDTFDQDIKDVFNLFLKLLSLR